MDSIYKKLRERLDMFPQGFPSTPSGVEIDILKHLFKEDEARLALAMRPYPEAVATIAERYGQDVSEIGETLYGMSKRGLILRYSASETERYYFLAPWMVGIWEFQLDNLTDENIELYERFYQEGMVPYARERKNSGFRVIPIEAEIESIQEVQPFEQVSEIINSQTKFAVAPCICRKEAQMVGEGCDKLLEACMMFGFAAEYYIENELAREITKEEALEVLAKAEADGLVHFSSNHQDNKIFICNCCSCCCKAMAHIVKYGNKNALAKSNYLAVLNEDSCDICEDCIDRCPVSAIQMFDDQTQIDGQSCIGCGLCISTCPTGSISMAIRPEDQRSPVFANQEEMLKAIGEEKNKPYPFE
ncbi:4Fe-4S binding protein [bacterium]|nr:4Fe-4S binding protein [bacterium]